MARRTARLTVDTLADLPASVRTCLFWELDPVAGGDDTRLGTALLLLPAFSVLMVIVNLALRPMLSRRSR